MSKTKILTLLVVILFLLNLTVLGFLFFNRPNEMRGNRPMPKNIIIKKLHFDKKQQAEYEKIIEKHSMKVEAIDNHIKQLKNDLYAELSKPINEQNGDIIIELISNDQKEIEKLHYNHFLEIKKICHPNQLKDFDDLTKELSRIFSPKPKPRERPNGEN